MAYCPASITRSGAADCSTSEVRIAVVAESARNFCSEL
jgi:hypothetical protein